MPFRTDHRDLRIHILHSSGMSLLLNIPHTLVEFKLLEQRNPILGLLWLVPAENVDKRWLGAEMTLARHERKLKQC